MTLKTRNILFTVFVIIFLVLTPAVSFYASGYKLGSGMNLEKTGILIVDTKPKSAFIYINGEIQQDFVSKLLKKNSGYITSPQKIKNLIPGEYTIKMEREGYWPWEKRLTIKPGESTFAEDVVLFKKVLPTLAINGNSQNGQILSDGNTFFYLSDKKLSINKNDNLSEITLANQVSDQALLSPDKNKIIADRTIYDLYNNNTAPLSLDKTLGNKAKNIQWGENDDEIFYINNNSLYSYNIGSTVTVSINNTNNTKNYLVKKGYIYVINNSNPENEFLVIDRNKNEVVKKISLPNANYEFRNVENDLINLYDTDHQIMHLIDPLSPFKPLQDSINSIKYSFWLNDYVLIYANDFEIWSYDVRNSQKTILTRISQPIKTVLAHPDENYIIFSTGNDINILELDDRDHYNITKILEIEKLDNLHVNKDGDAIYFNAKIGGQEGMFKLEI